MTDQAEQNKLRSILVHLYYKGYHEGKGDAPNMDDVEITAAQEAVEQLIAEAHKGYVPNTKCPTCFGRGKIWRDEHSAKINYEPDFPCPTCEGTGQITKFYTATELAQAVNDARLDEATKAREVAFNHRMDSGHDVALILAARVKGLTPTPQPHNPTILHRRTKHD